MDRVQLCIGTERGKLKDFEKSVPKLLFPLQITMCCISVTGNS